MKFTTYGKQNKSTKEANGQIADISLKQTNGKPDVVIITLQDGRKFSNFKTIWDSIGLNIEDIDIGDSIRIEYTEYETERFKWNNFQNLEISPSKKS